MKALVLRLLCLQLSGRLCSAVGLCVPGGALLCGSPAARAVFALLFLFFFLTYFATFCFSLIFITLIHAFFFFMFLSVNHTQTFRPRVDLVLSCVKLLEFPTL